jgi:hypothetical protein
MCLKEELQNQKISYGIEMDINKIGEVFANMIHGKPGILLQLQAKN